MNEFDKLQVNRVYKSRLFEMIFSQKEELLELYNAINNTDYDNTELLEINTLNNAIYMSMHNDVSFIIDSRLALYEHQSTYSPNLPLRYLMCVSDLYSVMTKDVNLYGTKAVELPTPKFIIFYNGEEELALELKAVMFNINPGHNIRLMDACISWQNS